VYLFIKRSRLISNTSHPLLLLCSLLLLSSCAQLPSHFYDLTNQQKIATEDLIQRIGDHRIIFVGEAHDSEIDHKVQLEVIRQLHESGRQVVIALEAVPAQQNSTLKSWYYGHASESSLIKNYYLNWTVPYRYYADIFRYAQSQRIKLIGLNLTRKKIRAVISNGVEKEPIEQRQAIKYSRCEQELDYARFMQSYWGNLGHKIAFSRLCDMQRFKDAFMAYQIKLALQEPESVVVVLVGSLHALKNAIPAMMRRHGWNNHLVMTSDKLSELTQAPLTKQQSDIVWP
jgi:uncharacterized iron-regulated protein